MSDEPLALKTALVVLGMHRSGTSAMAGTLSRLGASLPADPLPANFANPAGYYEPAPVTALNDEILSSLDSGWDDLLAGRPKRYLSNFDHYFHEKAGETLRGQYGDRDPILLKDPRINVLAAFWRRALEANGYRPFYIIMVRRPLEVAQSLRERDKFPLEKGLLLWLDNMVAVERDTRDRPRIFVAYDDLLADWSRVADRVERGSGMPLPRRTPAAANEIGLYLTSRFHHHVAREPVTDDRSAVWRRVRDAYEWFLAMARDEAPPRPEALDTAAEQLSEIADAMGPVLADWRATLRERETEAASQRALAEQASAAANAEMAEASTQRARAEQALAAANAEMAEAATQRARAEEALTAAEAEMAALRSEVAQRQAVAVAERDEALARAASAEEALRAGLEAATGREAEGDAAMRQATLNLQEAQARLQALATEHAQALRDGEAAEQTRRELEAETLLLHAMKEAARDRHREADADRRRLADELDVARRTAIDATAEVSSLSAEVRLLHARLNVAGQTLETAQAEAGLAAAERELMLRSRGWRAMALPRRVLRRLARAGLRL